MLLPELAGAERAGCPLVLDSQFAVIGTEPVPAVGARIDHREVRTAWVHDQDGALTTRVNRNHKPNRAAADGSNRFTAWTGRV